MDDIEIENDISMKALWYLRNVSNFNMPNVFPKGSYIDIQSGNVTELRIPDGVVCCFCENLQIKNIKCPPSLRELYCKNNNIHQLHVPENIRALDCSQNKITVFTCETTFPLHLHYLDISYNNICTIPFLLGVNLQTLVVSHNPLQSIHQHELDTFACDGDYHQYISKYDCVPCMYDVSVH
jgi:Leucine-rich repeat (LRR) protein